MSTTSYFVTKFTEHCKAQGTTPYFVAVETGVEPSLISAIINGRRNPKPATWHNLLPRLAACPLLNIDLATLVHWKAVDDYGVDLQARPELGTASPSAPVPGVTRRLKSLGYVAAGTLNTALPTNHDAVYYDLHDLPATLGDDVFVLDIVGDSMAPRFEAGGLLVVQPTNTLVPDRLYVFESDEAHRTFKLLTLDTARQQLTPLNSLCAPVPLKGLHCQRLYTVLEYRLRFY
jgi:SOS-response transcriptional repressor LexA